MWQMQEPWIATSVGFNLGWRCFKSMESLYNRSSGRAESINQSDSGVVYGNQHHYDIFFGFFCSDSSRKDGQEPESPDSQQVKTPEPSKPDVTAEERVELAAMHLGGKAKTWFDGYILQKHRRENNLCFKCDEKYVPDHQCKNRLLNLMEEEDNVEVGDITRESGGGSPRTYTSFWKFQLDVKLMIIQGQATMVDVDPVASTVLSELKPLLQEFDNIFDEPTGLPPIKAHDYRITLIPVSLPVNLRHYLFTHHQKVETHTRAIGKSVSNHKTFTRQHFRLITITSSLRSFIRGYGEISRPLPYLLKKDNFSSSLEAKQAFESLKAAMYATPILNLPDSSKQFYLETDASSRGVGVVSSQEGRPIAYLSKALGAFSIVPSWVNEIEAKFYGPFKVIAKIGKVAYKLDLSAESRLHPVFHVRLLKKRVWESAIVSTTPPTVEEDSATTLGKITRSSEVNFLSLILRDKDRLMEGALLCFSGIGQAEFFYSELPKTMSSVAANLQSLGASAGSVAEVSRAYGPCQGEEALDGASAKEDRQTMHDF
ncbi:hypothetical protein F3Y22_tig00013738pilonHSYRG00039 [Hibiscus syriacus]|uniref:Uncharacterized protein n=1 Tax=Hibiscus syriacus TaxID=106335 RepID=A0A6A3C0W5_HIBSY|nr:hypothetical protein F3Y22_tig00013738pilonHSYRG00039 [Hibiscus syriacus]